MRKILAMLIAGAAPLGRTEIEVLSAGARLAEELGGSLSAAIIGPAESSWATTCFSYGATKVFEVDSAVLASYQSEAFASGAVLAARAAEAEVILLASSTYALEIAPAVAYQLAASVTLDCIRLEAEPSSGAVKMTKPVYGGKANQELIARTAPVLVALRMRSVAPTEPQTGRNGEIVRLTFDFEPQAARTRIVERLVESSGPGKLEDARIIVSGGRGLGGAENFSHLEELANLLGGSVGASRAACDLGWVPASLQIGQTGKKVAPDLYLAVGISGASQHLVGVTGARHIVAVNKDPKAPIFQAAELGVVEDYRTFLPCLLQELRNRRNAAGPPG